MRLIPLAMASNRPFPSGSRHKNLQHSAGSLRYCWQRWGHAQNAAMHISAPLQGRCSSGSGRLLCGEVKPSSHHVVLDVSTRSTFTQKRRLLVAFPARQPCRPGCGGRESGSTWAGRRAGCSFQAWPRHRWGPGQARLPGPGEGYLPLAPKQLFLSMKQTRSEPQRVLVPLSETRLWPVPLSGQGAAQLLVGGEGGEGAAGRAGRSVQRPRNSPHAAAGRPCSSLHSGAARPGTSLGTWRRPKRTGLAALIAWKCVGWPPWADPAWHPQLPPLGKVANASPFWWARAGRHAICLGHHLSSIHCPRKPPVHDPMGSGVGPGLGGEPGLKRWLQRPPMGRTAQASGSDPLWTEAWVLTSAPS